MSAAVSYIANYANQLETLAAAVNQSIYANEIYLIIDGVEYYPNPDTLSFAGGVDCQQGQRVEMFGCGKERSHYRFICESYNAMGNVWILMICIVRRTHRISQVCRFMQNYFVREAMVI